MKKIKKKIIFLKTAAALILISVSVIFLFNFFNTKHKIEKRNELISEKLTSITELATSRYDYSNVVSVKNNLTFNDFNIPFTEKSFVVKYSGTITAGIDLSLADYSVAKDTLTINIPQPSILTNTIDEDKIYIFDEKTSIFNKLSMDDMLQEIVADKDKTEKALLEEGFLDKATENTIPLLQNIFSSCGFNEVIINLKH